MKVRVGDKVEVNFRGFYPNEFGVVTALPERGRVEVLFRDGGALVIPAYNLVRLVEKAQGVKA